ncbi:TetR/AcrR family transcriptional regulator [Actinomadura sp. WMMA1423]|uniref:TetR/AcrR family transcriptional regulator n=1 Tax=Actinomadura sp. WMMA1423 TaxID=2591108 RepID=UPI0011475D9B|nr:TetR/AcrR family transcriptional regulator [Actinomadura sp. WMMA1423]
MPRTPAAVAGETSRRIRSSAIGLFAERGFHGTGIRDIATGADVTLSSLYHHFGSKDDLLVDIMVTSTEPLKRAADEARRALATPSEQLAMLIEQHVWAHVTDRLAKIVTDTELRALSGDRRERVIALRDAYESVWRSTVEDGVAARVFTVPNTKALTIGLLEMCTAVSHWFRPSGELELHELCRTYADGGLALMRAARDGRPVRRADLDIGEPTRFLER